MSNPQPNPRLARQTHQRKQTASHAKKSLLLMHQNQKNLVPETQQATKVKNQRATVDQSTLGRRQGAVGETAQSVQAQLFDESCAPEDVYSQRRAINELISVCRQKQDRSQLEAVSGSFPGRQARAAQVLIRKEGMHLGHRNRHQHYQSVPREDEQRSLGGSAGKEAFTSEKHEQLERGAEARAHHLSLMGVEARGALQAVEAGRVGRQPRLRRRDVHWTEPDAPQVANYGMAAAGPQCQNPGADAPRLGVAPTQAKDGEKYSSLGYESVEASEQSNQSPPTSNLRSRRQLVDPLSKRSQIYGSESSLRAVRACRRGQHLSSGLNRVARLPHSQSL